MLRKKTAFIERIRLEDKFKPEFILLNVFLLTDGKAAWW
jgi:hypothetical protein